MPMTWMALLYSFGLFADVADLALVSGELMECICDGGSAGYILANCGHTAPGLLAYPKKAVCFSLRLKVGPPVSALRLCR